MKSSQALLSLDELLQCVIASLQCFLQQSLKLKLCFQILGLKRVLTGFEKCHFQVFSVQPSKSFKAFSSYGF